ncbi:hypothetical protein [Legionella feeleii]|uniref:Uncharacterized protein n=1 Tax=Legionella feeleii TaxID=453 RepID=A0A0W0U1M5_9GAMM|nr:hypothetical protein [Legionella feeleii]KTD01574.1 hypothetical protein Lfee_1004 [Legionella feeleii]SPX61930.1 Uncharacterised protein [Legionella feeleii]
MNEEQKQTLGQIKAMIDEWRKNKKNPAEKMPDDIWEAIFNLIETTGCPENEILKEIGIKPARLNNKRQSLGLAKPLQKDAITKNGLKATDEIKLIQFEITKPDGLIIKFQAPMSELKSILI